jgi:N-acetylated-alpha-linked acidic dipeptidase
LKLAFDWQVRPIYNVVARIEGAEFPDEWIVHGNHHDAWVNGAADPTSGNVALMETARGLAGLLESGWKPRRTIILAAWDAEEWGLLGSTEWVEKHREDLDRKGAVYINTDSTGRGWLSMGGSHSLQTFVNEVARDVEDPRGTAPSVREARRARDLSQARTDAERARIRQGDLPIDALGSGSDYTAFLDHLTIASLNLGFGGDDGGGVYHSAYDSFSWYTKFSDGDFTHSAALSQVIGTALLRLAGTDVLPFDFRGTASTLRTYADEVDRLARDRGRTLDFEPLQGALRRLTSSAERYERRLRELAKDGRLAGTASSLGELNRVLYSTERVFRHDPGLPRREWFKHLAYAPGLYTGYGVKTLPGIREGIEQGAWEEASTFIPIVTAAVNRLTAEVDRARGLLDRLSRQPPSRRQP